MRDWKYKDTAILVYAKAPIAGTVNTRLIADIGENKATQLQYDLVHHRLQTLVKAKLCQVILMCAPDSTQHFFTQAKKKYPILLETQHGNNLGERLYLGIQQALKKYDYCVVVGSDAPALQIDVIEQSIIAVKKNATVVIVPAEDGGYVLLAQRHAYYFLFTKIPWGSDKVLTTTVKQLQKNNLSYKLLASCWDIDRLEDYQRYQRNKHSF